MKKILCCLLVCASSSALAQRYLSVDEFDAINRSIRESHSYRLLATNAVGTPQIGYYSPNWIPGQVLSMEGKSIVRRAVRYNIAMQVLEVRDSSATEGLVAMPATSIAGFTLGLPGKHSIHSFETHTFTSPTGNVRGYFESLNKSGDVRLLLYYQIAERAAQRVEALAVEVWPAKLTRETQLFVTRPGQKTVKQIYLTKSAILRLFGKQADAVAAYAAQQNLNLEDVDGAARAVDYYNTLPH